MTLTQEQHAAITTTGNVRLTVDGIECVLVRSDVFDRVRNILGDDWTHHDMRLALARSSKENGWDEPGMEAYDGNHGNAMNRGDVVLVEVPYVGSPWAKVRPALIVQNDALNMTLNETIIAAITSNLAHTHHPHRLFIDISTPDGKATGLLMNSAVRFERLHTVPRSDVRKVIGRLSAGLIIEVDSCLRSALGIV